MSHRRYAPIFVLLFLLALPTVLANSHLPVGLVKGQEYNRELAQDMLQNVSFFIAFLAGFTTLLSPCILPLLPAYFAITFKEKKKITLATVLFFLGFAVVFIIMGLLTTLTGKTLVSVFKGIYLLVPAAGVFLVLFGIMILLGKGFSGFLIKKKFRNNPLEVFISGAAFAIGWTACIGPILSGMLLMTSTFGNYIISASLMFAYALGIFVPLFVLSFFYDEIPPDKLTWLKHELTINIFRKKIRTNTSNVIAGVLFVIIGLVFIVFRGTWVVNGLQMLGLRQYFYSLQNLFLQNASTFNMVGIVVFGIFAAFLLYFITIEVEAMKQCPFCRSDQIKFYMGGQFGKYECKKCGYVGALILEIDDTPPIIRSKPKK